MYPSPFKRQGSKYYQFWYDNPQTGKRSLKSTRQKTKKLANETIVEFVNSLNMSGATHANVTLNEYIKPWLDTNTNPRYQRYKAEGKNYGHRYAQEVATLLKSYVITDQISSMPMYKINRGHALSFRERLLASNVLSERKRTVNRIISSIKTVFSEGKYRGEVSYNPFEGIGNIKYETQDREILTIKELNKLLTPDNFSNDIAYQVFRFAAYTGMRMSEVLAVHWEQLKGDILTIDRAWIAPYELGPPKWGKERTIPLPKSVMNNLPPVNPERTDLIFQQGNARLGNTWWKKNFNAALKRAKIKKHVTPHCLRHSLNSHLLVNGVSPFLVQKYLGWSRDNSLTKTLEGYTHVMPEHLRLVAEAIDDIYSGKKKVLPFRRKKNAM